MSEENAKATPGVRTTPSDSEAKSTAAAPANLLRVPPGVLTALIELADTRTSETNPHRVLFRAGREWGYRDEQDERPESMEPRGRLLAVLERLPYMHLARAKLIEFQYASGDPSCFITCQLLHYHDGPATDPRKPQDRSALLLAAGYLTGWLSSMTGIDLICQPLHREPLLREGDDSNTFCSFRPRTFCSKLNAPQAETNTRNASHFILDDIEGSLAGKELALADLVENTLDTVMFLDLDDVIRFWNQGATMMFQYESEEIIGQTVGLLFPRDLIEEGELELLKNQCDHDGVVHNHVTRRVRKDGQELWVSLTRTALHDHRGEPLGAAAILRDITEQRSRDEELRRSKHLASVGELAATVAHEVKNPLTGIYAALQVLEGQLDEEDPRREIFGSICGEVMRLNDFTQGLLDFARPPAAQLMMGNLYAFLVDLVRDLEHLSLAEPGRVILELERELNVRFDRDLTGHVFKNLILNALQAMPRKGTVRLRSVRRADWLIIDVADSGPGVKPKERATVFEPFFTTKAKGTGLGLAIAKKNIEAQGGTIRLRRQRQRGATFRVEFPKPTGL